MTEVFDGASEDVADPHDSDLEPLPPRSGRRLSLWLLGFVVLGLALAGIGGAWFQMQLDPPGRPGAPVPVVIPDGSSVARIAAILDEKGVIRNARVFRLYVRLKGSGSFQAGEYNFRQNESADEVIAALTKGPAYVFKGDKVTIPEGFTLKQIADRVGSIPGFSGERFLALTQSGEIRSQYQPPDSTNMEGLLYPETYLLEKGADERSLLIKMVDTFDAQAAAAGIDKAADVGLTPYEAIIVASLIERETRFDEERGKISQVIQNRLAKKMQLQLDATVVYALGGGKTRVLSSDLLVDSPYNTYKIAGLTPTPIASPSRASLDAAVNPTPGPWVFYVVTEKDGRHSFAITYDEQLRNIQKAKERGVR